MEKKYIDAFYEVYQIINLLDNKLYVKIPSKIIDKFEKISKLSTSDKIILPYISLSEQNISYEGKALLKFIYLYLE